MNRKFTGSGLSAAIKKTMDSYEYGKPLVERNALTEFKIKVANTLEERLAAYQLGYKVYLNKGFIVENSDEWLIQKYDSFNDTVVLIVQDQYQKIAGSVTIVFDGANTLPSEKIYHDELKNLRNSGGKLTELSRLVISSEYRNAKEILILLFNYAAIYIRNVKNYNGLTIQVNPRHKAYYKSLLNFDEVGGEKPCPQVQNAPAVLLYISESKYQYELNRHRNQKEEIKKDHTLYKYFLKAEQENLVAYYLRKQATPMPEDEKIYFGIKDTNPSKIVIA